MNPKQKAAEMTVGYMKEGIGPHAWNSALARMKLEESKLVYAEGYMQDDGVLVADRILFK